MKKVDETFRFSKKKKNCCLSDHLQIDDQGALRNANITVSFCPEGHFEFYLEQNGTLVDVFDDVSYHLMKDQQNNI